jgi:hypothetical protein
MSAKSRIDEAATSVPDAGPPRTALDGWTAVATVTATLAPEYQIVVATLADSNGTGPNRATLMVRALTGTPGVFYDSEPDSGCSVDNLPPAQPVSFNGSNDGGAFHLSWRANVEPDLCCYRVHRGVTLYFEPSPGNLIATLSDTSCVDPDPGPAGSCYKLSAVDVNGNPSAFALLIPGGTVDVAGIATWSLTLGRVEPNPSRGEGLLVRFTLPTAAPARLELLDVSGRRVLERAVGAMGPGPHALELAARHLAAGIYVLRLSQGGSVLTTRVAVLK